MLIVNAYLGTQDGHGDVRGTVRDNARQFVHPRFGLLNQIISVHDHGGDAWDRLALLERLHVIEAHQRRTLGTKQGRRRGEAGGERGGSKRM